MTSAAGVPAFDRSRLDGAVQVAGDAAVAGWLWLALYRFTAPHGPSWPSAFSASIVVALLASVWHINLPQRGQFRGRCLRLAGLWVTLAAIGLVARRFHLVPLGGLGCVWVATAACALVLGLRGVSWRHGRLDRGELVRWIALGAAAVGATRPFYTLEGIGAGDAQWYTLMQADVTTQLRAGVFPVWVGQSLYAYNGAVMPIRYAPGFQYFGGLLDLLTAHVLHPTELKNLTLVVTALLGGGSAYYCLRRILSARPWTACLLAVAWIWCPGVLAPLTVGDQYMTFLTLPWVPVVLYGCWRMATEDSPTGWIMAAAALAGAWLCHPPVAFWSTLITMGIGLFALVSRPSSRWQRALAFGGTFAVLGAYPFVSVFTLENRFHDSIPGLVVAEQVEAAFPSNLEPIASLPGMGSYQLGYFLVGVWLLTLAAACVTRGRGFRPFLVASVALIPITMPVPGLTRAFWHHAPGWLVSINNVWPMQRFFLIWSALIAFAAAALLRCRAAPSSRSSWWTGAAAILALAWPIREGLKLEAAATRTRSPPGSARMMESLNNATISRYAYGAFEFTPAYASHGFVDAWLENRLLDRVTQDPVITNAEAAAPVAGSPGIAGVRTRLLQSGDLMAKNIPSSDYYELLPHYTLEPGRHYALRLQLAPRGITGTLQIADSGLFREYLLPDSGIDLLRHGPSRSFGALEGSGQVVSLTDDSPGAKSPVGLVISIRPARADFGAGRFWLYDYDRASLPVAVESWIPYRARVNSPAALYLETPRVWLHGWHATVDGRPAKVLRSNQNLVMVPVEPGTSTVTLRYEPSWLLALSFWAALVGWMLLGASALGLWLAKGPDPLGE